MPTVYDLADIVPALDFDELTAIFWSQIVFHSISLGHLPACVWDLKPAIVCPSYATRLAV